MSHQWRLATALVTAVALAACGVQDAPADIAHKALLEGAWRYQSQDTAGQQIGGTVRLGPTGLFSGTEQNAGAPDDVYSGEWFVTAGLLKLKTTRSGGQRLGTAQTGYFTCTLQALEARAFACHHDGSGRTYSFRRLAG